MLNLQILNKIEGAIRILIINEAGQIVYSQQIENGINNNIDFSRYSRGIYFIKIAFKSGAKTIKIVKK